MKYNLYFFMGDGDKVSYKGLSKEGSHYFIDIPDEEFFERVMELNEKFAVMIKNKTSIWLDRHPWRFQQR